MTAATAIAFALMTQAGPQGVPLCQTSTVIDVIVDKNAFFGYPQIRIEGPLAAVTALSLAPPNVHTGTAYVLRHDGATWNVEQQLCSLDAELGDEFGASIDVSGDVIVVGATNEGPGFFVGAAYVFRHNGISWVQEQKLTLENGQEFDQFGQSVAVDGDTLMVGAHGGPDKVFVYGFDGLSWVLQQTLEPSDKAMGFGRNFGASMAMEDGKAIIGAPGDDELGAPSAGAAYAFGFNGVEWVEQEKLLALNGEANDGFGCEVALSGDVAVAGTDPNAMTACVFRFDGVGWPREQELIGTDTVSLDHFGQGVGICGNTILVGAYDDDDAAIDAGAIYQFEYDGTTWVQQFKIVAADAALNDSLGRSFGYDGGDVLVRSSGPDVVYVFEGCPDTCPWDCGDGDGQVGIIDFLALLGAWNLCGVPCDLDGSGVGITDFLALLAHWGACP